TVMIAGAGDVLPGSLGDAHTWTRPPEQTRRTPLLALDELEVDALVRDQRGSAARALLERVALNARSVLAGDALRHVLEHQVRDLDAAAARNHVLLQRHDLAEQALREAYVVSREEVRPGLGQREEVPRTARPAAHLRDRNVAV